MLTGPLVFVDIETNGLDAKNGHIIEVAVIRVEHGEVVREFKSLIDPGVPIPYFISQLTGISDDDVRTAPSFSEVAEELEAIMNGAIFVAHNVNFDYSFLKYELQRSGIMFDPQKLCTVKLSKALYPEYRTHKLADLIQRHNFSFAARHRAYDDAFVLWQFLRHVQETFSITELNAAAARQLHV